MIYLSYLVYALFRCVNSGSFPSAKTIQSYLSKRYFEVYILEVSPMLMFQVCGLCSSYCNFGLKHADLEGLPAPKVAEVFLRHYI